MKTRFPSKPGGFTLVEMVVTMTVLTLMLMLFAQIFGQASGISERTTRQLSAFSGAVMALDRLSVDLARRVRGENTLAASNDGKSLAFYTQVPNADANSRLSLVTYRVENGRLLRNVQAVEWVKEITQPPVSTTGGEVLAAEVFGLQFSFLRRDGRVYPTPDPDEKRNAALVATIACLDLRSRRRSDDADSTLATLNTSSLPGVTTAGSTETPLRLWDAMVLSPQAEGLESALRQHVAFYERYYSLD